MSFVKIQNFFTSNFIEIEEAVYLWRRNKQTVTLQIIILLAFKRFFCHTYFFLSKKYLVVVTFIISGYELYEYEFHTNQSRHFGSLVTNTATQEFYTLNIRLLCECFKWYFKSLFEISFFVLISQYKIVPFVCLVEHINQTNQRYNFIIEVTSDVVTIV